jgi:hypothetical protein
MTRAGYGSKTEFTCRRSRLYVLNSSRRTMMTL